MSLFIGQRGNNSSFHIWKCRVCTLVSHTAHITNVQTTTNTCWLLSATLNQWVHAETLVCWRWAVWWTRVLDACAWVPVTETGFVWLSEQSWDICVFLCVCSSSVSSFHQQVWRGQCLLLPSCHTCSLPLKLVQCIEHVRFRHYTDLLTLRWWQSCKCYWWTAGWLWKESSWTTKVWSQQHEKV